MENRKTYVLSFNSEQAQYVKNYPLHSSQKIIKETKDEIVFELYLYITGDFIRELLSYGLRTDCTANLCH
jgi:hypothetical protein